MLTINALTAADSVIIPVQAQYLPAKGLEQLLRTITRVKRQLNPKLEVDGIVLTMVRKSCSSPLAGRYCACTGIITLSAAVRALMVSIPSDGIQSMSA